MNHQRSEPFPAVAFPPSENHGLFPRGRPRVPAAALLCMAALLLCAGCSLFRAHPLVGQWRAESFDLNGLKLPVGPEMTFTRDSLVVGSEVFSIDRVETQGGNVTVFLKSGMGLSFVMDGDNRMRFVVPVLGTSIRYERR